MKASISSPTDNITRPPRFTTVAGALWGLSALFLPMLAWAAEPAKENVPGGALMLGAYILIWAIPLTFLWASHRRLNSLEADLQALKSMLDKIPQPEAAAGTEPPGDPA